MKIHSIVENRKLIHIFDFFSDSVDNSYGEVQIEISRGNKDTKYVFIGQIRLDVPFSLRPGKTGKDVCRSAV